MGKRRGSNGLALLGMAGLVLGGCMGTGEEGAVSRFLSREPGSPAAAEPAAQRRAEGQSDIIDTLQARRSLLPPGGSYDTVARAVLAADSRTGEAELRAARLRASAASKNWLPRIGPGISLVSLGEVVANLVAEQVLFDHGRLKAERAFAKADVEVAAVTLADDVNARVFTALGLYLDAAAARERAALHARTLTDMERFEWVMAERVRGGVSDRSDLSVLRQKIGEIRSDLAAAQEAAQAALAELGAMSDRPLDGVSGLGELAAPPAQARALSVLLSEAERERSVAQARIDRAGLLPGLTASGTLGDSSDGSIDLGGALLGLGTGDSLKAIAVARDAADRRVGQAEEDAARRLTRLRQRADALSRQVGEAGDLSRAARANLDLFQEQYDAGQRQVMDVVGVYETFAARESQAVALRYERALAEIEIARLLGLLVDGSDV